ncbi:MAG: phage tail protein, partial [Pseudomonadota bacterium]
MPEYLAPGVYVEETSFRARSIEGVGTSVAGIVGPTRTGPVRGAPEVVTSFNGFLQMFGGLDDLTLGGEAVANHTALGARAFFENGGRQLYVARVLGGVNGTDETGRNGSAAAATVTDANTRVRFDARFPGSGGNLTFEITWDDSQSLLRATTVTEIEDGETALLEIADDLPGASFNGTGAHAGFPLRGLTALVTRAGDDLVFVANTNARVINADPAPLTAVSVPVTDIGAGIAIATLPQGAVLRRVRVAPPV